MQRVGGGPQSCQGKERRPGSGKGGRVIWEKFQKGKHNYNHTTCLMFPYPNDWQTISISCVCIGNIIRTRGTIVICICVQLVLKDTSVRYSSNEGSMTKKFHRSNEWSNLIKSLILIRAATNGLFSPWWAKHLTSISPTYPNNTASCSSGQLGELRRFCSKPDSGSVFEGHCANVFIALKKEPGRKMVPPAM